MKNNTDKMIINGVLSCILNTLYSKNMNPINNKVSIIAKGKNTLKDKSVGLVWSDTPPKNKKIEVI